MKNRDRDIWIVIIGMTLVGLTIGMAIGRII